MQKEPVIVYWNVPESPLNAIIAQQLAAIGSRILGQVIVETEQPEGKVVYTVLNDGVETMFFGEFQFGDKTVYDVEAVRSNFARAAAKWDAQSSDKFPLLKHLICDSWQNMVDQVYRQTQ